MRQKGVRLFSALLVLAVLAGFLPGKAVAADPERSGTMEYYSAITGDYVSSRYEYSDQWFLGAPAARNDRLALVSAQLATAAGDGEHGAAFLKELGFADASGNRYDSEDPADCGYAIGTKTIQRDGKDCTLVAVAFQGTFYGEKGWQQNVTVNGESLSGDHAAYAAAANGFLADLDGMDLKGPVIFWLTGMSRAGGIANLAASYLLDREEPPAVFALTFESPATTENTDAGAEKYRGIRNYICRDDPVTMLPIWGMSRYGQDVPYDGATPEAIAAVLGTWNPAAADFARRYDAELFDDSVPAYLEGLIGKLTEAVPTRAAYSEENTDRFTVEGSSNEIHYSYQGGLQALCRMVQNSEGGLSDAVSPLLDDETALPNLTCSYLEEAYAAAHEPENAGALLSDAALRRWTVADTFYNTLTGEDQDPTYRREDVYALLKLLSPLVVKTDAVRDKNGALPAFDASFAQDYADYFDLHIVMSFAMNTDTLLFSHYPDVILARLKLLTGFSDVPPDAYYAPAVDWAVSSSVTAGTGDGLFSPEASCTRGQTVTFLWRAAGSPEPERGENPFTDVESGAYYEKAILWAVERGITEGTDGTHFSPEETVSRCQSVTFLYRLAGEETGAPNPFADVKEDAFCFDSVRWAAANGVTTGKTADRFAPADDCTRAQIVTFLYRALGQAEAAV